MAADAATCLSHPSGRPWIVGEWAEDAAIVAHSGGVALALFGCCSLTAAELRAETAHLTDITQLDRLAGRLPGSIHVVASVDGHVRVQGTASGLRRVFYTRIGGVTVAADSADKLASTAQARLDDEWLASRLLQNAPHVLAQQPVWHGVHAVPPSHHLTIDPTGGCRLRQWWQPPTPTVPLAEGARALREALVSAVTARTATAGNCSADLQVVWTRRPWYS